MKTEERAAFRSILQQWVERIRAAGEFRSGGRPRPPRNEIEGVLSKRSRSRIQNTELTSLVVSALDWDRLFQHGDSPESLIGRAMGGIETALSEKIFEIELVFKGEVGLELDPIELGGPLRVRIATEWVEAGHPLNSTPHVDLYLFLRGNSFGASPSFACERFSVVAEECLGVLLMLGLGSCNPEQVLTNEEFGIDRSVEFRARRQNDTEWTSHDLDPGLIRRVLHFFLRDPSAHQLGEIGRAARERDDCWERVITPRFAQVSQLVASTETECRSLCTACRWLFRSSTSRDPGEVAFYAALALEARFIGETERSAISDTLSNRVRYLVASSTTIRKEISEQIKRIYEARSKYVHSGVSDFSVAQQVSAVKLVSDALRREWEVVRTSLSSASEGEPPKRLPPPPTVEL